MPAAWLFLAGAIGLEVTATLCLRASAGFSRWVWAVPIVGGYAGAFFLLSLVLVRGIPIGVAYGVWSAVGVVLTAVMGRLVFGDAFTPAMAIGVLLIGAGVVLLELGSHSPPA